MQVMARKVRIERAGACYHVINRGNYRRDLFASKGAAQSYQTWLCAAVRLAAPCVCGHAQPTKRKPGW